MRVAKPHIMTQNKANGKEFYIEWKENGIRRRLKTHSGLCNCDAPKCEHSVAAQIALVTFAAPIEVKPLTIPTAKPLDAKQKYDISSAISEYLQSRDIGAGTLRSYKTTLAQFTLYCSQKGFKLLKDIDGRALTEFRVELQHGAFESKSSNNVRVKERKANTINIAVRNLSAFFSYCHRFDYIKVNPVTKAKSLSEKRSLRC